MDGLEHGISLADVGATGRAHSALKLSSLIGQNVSVEVRQDNNLEARLRVSSQSHTNRHSFTVAHWRVGCAGIRL